MLKGVKGVHHIAISTGRWDEMVDFYTNLLGFEPVDAFEWRRDEQAGKIADAVTGLRGTAARAMLLKGPNLCIELFEFRSPAPKTQDLNRPVCDHGFTHLALDVENIDEVYATLCARGMRFHTHVQNAGGGIRNTYGRDPDGNVIEIQELTDPDDPGRLAF